MCFDKKKKKDGDNKTLRWHEEEATCGLPRYVILKSNQKEDNECAPF